MPVIDKPVSLGEGDQALHGSLVLPEQRTPCDAVLIWSGSGPTDRDGNSRQSLNNNGLKMLAHALGDAGYVSLRADKRGIGESAAAVRSEHELRFETYVDDAVSWANFLKDIPQVRQVFLLGHSEGGLVATMVAERFRSAGLILLAAVGFPAADIIRRQLAGPGIVIPPDQLDEIHTIMRSLEAGETVASISPELGVQYRPSVQPYLISWFKYDPAAELAKTEIPVLVIQGTNDLQVTLEDADRLATARDDVSLIKIKGMNHVLKEAPKDREDNFATYRKPLLPLEPSLMPSVLAFLESIRG